MNFDLLLFLSLTNDCTATVFRPKNVAHINKHGHSEKLRKRVEKLEIDANFETLNQTKNPEIKNEVQNGSVYFAGIE